MNKEQFLLMKLAEECVEISQRAIKQIQYGAQEIQEGQGLTNLQRLINELKDAVVICELLQDLNPDFSSVDKDWPGFKAAKIEKLNHYLAYSRKLGQIKGKWNL